jgi:hypothetical protein
MYVLKAVGGAAVGLANCSRFASVRPGGRVAQAKELEISALEWCVQKSEAVEPGRRLVFNQDNSENI